MRVGGGAWWDKYSYTQPDSTKMRFAESVNINRDSWSQLASYRLNSFFNMQDRLNMMTQTSEKSIHLIRMVF